VNYIDLASSGRVTGRTSLEAGITGFCFAWQCIKGLTYKGNKSILLHKFIKRLQDSSIQLHLFTFSFNKSNKLGQRSFVLV